MDAKRENAAAGEARGVPKIDQLGGTVSTETTAPSSASQARRGGRRSRDAGNRIERELVERHRAIGIKSERYPASGATRFRGSGHDVDVYALGPDEAPLVAEVKG